MFGDVDRTVFECSREMFMMYSKEQRDDVLDAVID